MTITFLDLEKAFDKVQHCRLWIALRRLGIHDTFVEVLKDCYAKAPFLLRMNIHRKDALRRNKTRLPTVAVPTCTTTDVRCG